MELLSAEEGRAKQFPVGMRVLAVDDNPTCLGKLRDLLLLCKYHVTTTTESKKALEMLRDKRNMFDLVITDAEMPETDGFKLLEIGREMGLPVIMMSAHCDNNSVMKGVTHGACDYLLKPVGLKELRNIWQHVVKNNISKYAKNKGLSEPHLPPSTSNKQDDCGREKKDGEGSEHNGQEPCTLKKKRLRVAWTTELHQKFLTAVEQLGFEKAIPKKIRHLMNVPGLERIDVASHLQKYRLSFKCPSYFPMAQPDGLGNFTATRQVLPTSVSNKQEDKVNDSVSEKEDDEGIKQNGQESCTLKNRRVVWTTELHQKFLTAVEQLGFEKAVPQKIHKLMNVEGLTRADMASHLQKNRLFLKKVQELQQQNMAPDAFGTKALSYFPKAQLDGQSSSSLLSHYHLTKLHPSACSSINLQGDNSSSVTQQGQNSSNSAYPVGTYHQDTLLPKRVENVDLFQPTTITPLEPLLFPESKSSAYMKSIGGVNSCYQINNQQHKYETVIKFPNIPEVTKKDDTFCRFPIMMERFSYGGATRRHRFFFPLMLAAAIALSTFLWFFVSL